MNLTDEDVLKILMLVEESNFDSLQLKYGDLNLTVSKSGYIPGLTVAEAPSPSVPVTQPAAQPVTEPTVQAATPTKVTPSPEEGSSVSTESQKEISEEDGLVTIKAPMVGTFYYSPEPGAKPFISVGSKVDEDTTVGLIEVMKVFSGVAAGIKGEIVRVLVKDAQLVEYGQPIILVRPEV